MSSGDKSKSSSQTDGKAAQGKKSEMGMMSYKVSVFSNGRQTKTIFCQTLTHPVCTCLAQMYVFDQENFQGRMIEISNECMNVCELGMDRVRSLRVECGP